MWAARDVNYGLITDVAQVSISGQVMIAAEG